MPSRRLALLLALGLAACLLLAWALPGEPFLLGGIQVNEPDHAAWVAALAGAEMNALEVTVYAKQGDWDSANLWWEEEEPWVVAEARAAKARGLHVVLVLRVALDHAFPANRFLWHGMIQPASEEELAEWFRRYREFVAQWAAIAAREGVDVLAIGSEMNSLASTVPVAAVPALEEYYANREKVERERRRILAHAETVAERHLTTRGTEEGWGGLDAFLDAESAVQAQWARRVAFLDEADPVAAINRRRTRLEAGWRGVVAAARARFAGPLTYAANFDQYEQVGFWGALDLVGINAYFPLRSRLLAEEGSAELEPLLAARWEGLLRGIDAWRRAAGVPAHRVLFTELGYVARANSTLRPWAADGFAVLPGPAGDRVVVWRDQPWDRIERAAAVNALYDAHRAVGGDLLAGILWWKLTTVPDHESFEPFALVIGPDAPWDPLREALARFAVELPWDRARARVRALLAAPTD
jgi:hypothetical protein